MIFLMLTYIVITLYLAFGTEIVDCCSCSYSAIYSNDNASIFMLVLMITAVILCYIWAVGSIISYGRLWGFCKKDFIALCILTVIFIIYVLGVLYFGATYHE